MSTVRWSDIRDKHIEVDRYVTALGYLLEVVANFGDEQFTVG